MAIKFAREWAMPSHNTFSIQPIRDLIARHFTPGVWLDPFSRCSPFASRCVTNDLDPVFPADHHLDAFDFLRLHADESVDGVLFDPPYSPRQIAECYRGVGRAVHMEDTQAAFYGDRKREAARVVKPGGKVLCFGWNSGGLGKALGFDLVEVLLVAHGGAHNDTICTVETKTRPMQITLI